MSENEIHNTSRTTTVNNPLNQATAVEDIKRQQGDQDDDPSTSSSRTRSGTGLFYYYTRKKRISKVDELKRSVRRRKCIYYFCLVLCLGMHWIDMGTDLFMINYYWEHSYKTYYCIASVFFVMSTFLSLFWNFQLFNRSFCYAISATILGPIARNIFVEVLPSPDENPEGWRNSDEVYTEEVKNFTMIFAALFEDLPQASVNLAFLTHTDNSIPIQAVIQVLASIVMGIIKIQHGCHNILCNYEEWEQRFTTRLSLTSRSNSTTTDL